MTRAAKVADGRNLQLRVVALPAGSDPADVVQDGGPDAMRELVAASVPFVTFRVQRELADGRSTTAEGKDAVIDALRPVFAEMSAGALRDELERTVASAPTCAPTLVASCSRGRRRGGRPAEPPRAEANPTEPVAHAPRRPMSRAERIERTFLALCIALPGPGRDALARVTEDSFGGPLHARAAAHLRAHLDAPTEGIGDDPELAQLLTELAVRAARWSAPRPLSSASSASSSRCSARSARSPARARAASR